MARDWQPCRVCGEEHTNPSSSSICPSCGAKERAANEAERAANAKEKEEGYKYMPASYRLVDRLDEALGPGMGQLIKELIEAVVDERAYDSSPDREYD